MKIFVRRFLRMVMFAMCTSVAGASHLSRADDGAGDLPSIDALRARWAASCEEMSNFRVVVDDEYRTEAEGKIAEGETRFESLQKDGKRIHIGGHSLVAYNPDELLGFEIKRSDPTLGGTQGAWLLLDAEHLSAVAESTRSVQDVYFTDPTSYSYRATCDRRELGPYCLLNVPLQTLLAPDRVVSLDIARAEGGAIQIDAFFVDDRAKAPRAKADFVSGHIRRLRATLDPDDYYVLEAVADFNGETGAYKSFRSEYTYDESAPYPTPLLIETSAVERQGEKLITWTRYRSYERDPPISDAVFTLEHYGLPGLPESRSPGSYRTPAWLYYFVGGVLTVIVGAFFVHRATKARA